MRGLASALLGLAIVVAPTCPARATLVKAKAVSIETRGTRLLARTFTLTYRARGVSLKRVSGSATSTVELRRTDVSRARRRRRSLAGREVLQSASGTLTLRWLAVQACSRRRCGDVHGRWAIVAATGAYAGQTGHGELTARARFESIDYSGVLITAE